MSIKLKTIKFSQETLVAALLIAIFSGFILFNFAFEFNLFFWIITAIFGLNFSIIYPRAGVYAAVVLMLVFANFFSLQSLIVNNIEYKFYLLDIILIGSLFGVFLRIIAGKIKFKLRYVDYILIAFLLLTIIYYFVSVFYLNSFFHPAFSSFKNYMFYPLLYFIIYFLFTKQEHWDRFFKFLIVGATSIIGFIIYGLVTGKGLWTDITPLTTSGSRILDFNHAFYLSAIFLIALIYIVFKKNIITKYFYIIIPIFLIGIVGSLMRHLWIALFFTLIMIYVLFYKKYKIIFKKIFTKYIAIGLMIFSVVFLFISLFPFSKINQDYFTIQDNVITRVASTINTKDTSIDWRSTVWKGVWKKYRKNLIFGLGFGKRIYINMGGYSDYVELRNMHNSWLAILTQMGLVGIVLLFWFILRLLKKVLIKKQNSINKNLSIIKFSTVSILIFCAIAFLFQPYLEANFFSWLFWINLGFMRRYYEGIIS